MTRLEVADTGENHTGSWRLSALTVPGYGMAMDINVLVDTNINSIERILKETINETAT